MTAHAPEGPSSSPPSSSLLSRTAARSVDVVLVLFAAWLLFGPGGSLRRELDRWIEERRRARLVQERWGALVEGAGVLGMRVEGAGGVTGPGGARGTALLVEFTDYRCPYCRTAHAAVKALLDRRPDARVVVRHLPIPGLHPDAPLLARVSVCAETDPAWPAVHDALFDAPGGDAPGGEGADRILESRLTRLLASAGVTDPEGIVRCAHGPAARRRVQSDLELARTLGVAGTPTFVSNRGVAVGALSADELLEMLGPADLPTSTPRLPWPTRPRPP